MAEKFSKIDLTKNTNKIVLPSKKTNF